MRRILLIVAMLLIATPAFAAITVNAKHIGLPTLKAGINCNVCEVNYVCTAGERVRAFALDINVGTGYTITGIQDFNVGESNHVGNGVAIARPGFGIFPGKFRDVINAADVNWVADSNYNPIAPATDADAAGTGLGTNRIIVELGSLYAGDSNKPLSSGILCRFVIAGAPRTTTNITIAANATRGGVVLEDGNTAALGTGTGQVAFNGHTSAGFPECFPCWAPYNTQYAWFIDPVVGKPNCWCGQYGVAETGLNWSYQCYGDADGKTENPLYKYRVFTSDYNKLVANWRKKATQLKVYSAECADFDHMQENPLYKYRVYTSDYNRLVANWRKKDTQLKGAPCPGPNASSSY